VFFFVRKSEEDFEEDENVLGLDDLQRRGAKPSAASGITSSKPEVIMESNQDAAEWKLEVERVLPQLLPDKKRQEKQVVFFHLAMTVLKL
jgi:hypothetical protein